MPDYLAVGSDEDFLRMPMTPASAKVIADAFGCRLPTREDRRRRLRAGRREARAAPAHRSARSGPTRSRSTTRIIEEQRTGKPLGAPRRRASRRTSCISNKLKDKPEQGRDLRLAQARRQADPAAVRRPRRLVRRLQPRHPTGEPDGDAGRQATATCSTCWPTRRPAPSSAKTSRLPRRPPRMNRPSNSAKRGVRLRRTN